MYKLVIQDDEGKTTVVPLIRDELTIGRKEGNTIRLTERNVSRRHARLVRASGAIAIEDLNSYNGIRVNGTRIQGRAAIKESDRVQIGDYLIEIKSEAQDTAHTAPVRPGSARLDAAAPDAASATDSGAQPTQPVAAKAADVNATTVPGFAVVDSMLSDSDPAIAVPAPATGGVSAHGRLVALSTLFAGQEFGLDRPVTVIGRTDENDVCLNHRSISRHHAKVVREAGRYAIVDLQSSNGVRVNGEEYGKVELRKGDLVDLGHVRLRFVEAGEDFVFGRDAQAVEMEAAGGSRAPMWIALVLLVAAAGVVLYLLASRDGGLTGTERADDRDRVVPVEPTVTPVASPTPVPTPTPTPAVTPDPGAAPTDDLSKRIAAARQAIAAESWTAAADEAKAALAIDPQRADAKELAEQAELEQGQQAIFARFTKAADADKLAEARGLFETLDDRSVYKAKAAPRHDQMRQDYLRAQGAEGRKLAERGRCRDQKRLAAEVERAVGVEGRDAVMATACAEAAAPPPRPTPTPAPRDPGEAPAAPGPDNGGPSADELLEEARAAAKSDQMAKALRLCQGALAKRPGDSDAAQICVIAACNLKAAATAKKYIDKVKSSAKVQALEQICLNKGVQLTID